MNAIVHHFLLPLSPVLSVVGTSCVLIVLECSNIQLPRLKTVVCILGGLLSFVFTTLLWKTQFFDVGLLSASEIQTLMPSGVWLLEFVKAYRLDSSTLLFYLLIATFMILANVFYYAHLKEHEHFGGILLLNTFVGVGIMLLVSSGNLLMVFLALELLSLPTYVLVGIQQDNVQSTEGALKYFLFGSFGSVLLILGTALLYAQVGSVDLAFIQQSLAGLDRAASSSILIYAALSLLIAAGLFKIGAVPFHLWIPDAYQGAPTPVTGFMGSAVKLAGFGLLIRLFWEMFLPLIHLWGPVLDVLAVLTMFLGNIAALNQNNLKRLFAYSSIAHAGTLLLGISSLPREGIVLGPLHYYLTVYGLMFLGLFSIISLLERRAEKINLYDLSGLGFTHPLLGACLTLFALSSAGLPPTAGFFAKYFIFVQAVRSGKTFIVALALIASLIGVYYYLRVLIYLYMKESKERVSLKWQNPVAVTCTLLCAISMIYFTFAPFILDLFRL